MPTYDYRCKACGHEFELFQSMSAKPERTCPACGKKSLERLIGTGAALLFKGSGFYQTDYRSESYKKSADADKPAAPAPDTKTGDAKSGDSKTGDAKATPAKPAEPAGAKAPEPKPVKPPTVASPASERRAPKHPRKK